MTDADVIGPRVAALYHSPSIPHIPTPRDDVGLFPCPLRVFPCVLHGGWCADQRWRRECAPRASRRPASRPHDRDAE